MGFERTFLHLLFLACLFLVRSLLAQQQNDPCALTDSGEIGGLCGLNGICQASDLSRNCTCPPGFSHVNSDNPSQGCRRNRSQLQKHCNSSGARMHRIDQIDWPGNDYWSNNSTNQTACQQACIEDCFCTVVIYANLSDGEYCWKKALPLRIGAVRDTRTAFVKVFDGVDDAVPPTPSKQRREEKRKGFAVLGISLMACSFVIVVILLFFWLFICRPKMKSLQTYHKFNPIGVKAFSYKELDAATGGFKIEIGRGAFGTVYKGTLTDGRAIAVKKLDDQLKKENPQDGEKEFRTEMGIIGASYHKNLVQLYGFCDQGNYRILVYEYMPNGSLDNHLFEGRNDLNWELRVQIVLGIARGIFYLHEECRAHIIHCDIKPQNVLLDENYCAKISDFGIAKLLGAEQTRTFSLARGTLGYMAPEWQKTMAVSVKVDVYSFGVVLLEIICCRKMLQLGLPENETMLSRWAYDCFKHGSLAKLVEQQDCRGMEVRQLERMVLVGLWCIQEDPSLRPSIKKVVQMLEGTVEIAVPPNPGSFP